MENIMDEIKIPLPKYGVWIPGKGWVRGSHSRPFADLNRDIATQLRNRIGSGAIVYYIDDALVDLEQELLDAEYRKTFAWFFNRLKIGLGK
jgi:hypothetical protein